MNTIYNLQQKKITSRGINNWEMYITPQGVCYLTRILYQGFLQQNAKNLLLNILMTGEIHISDSSITIRITFSMATPSTSSAKICEHVWMNLQLDLWVSWWQNWTKALHLVIAVILIEFYLFPGRVITLISSEFAKLRAFRAYLPYVPTCLTCLRVFVSQISTCLRALNYYLPTCLRTLIFHVPTCLHAYIYFSCLRAFVP